jgi:HSP20 family protein
MAEIATKLPVRTEDRALERSSARQAWHPFQSLRREVDRLFDDFDRDSWRSPFGRSVFDMGPSWRRELSWGATPAMDIIEKDNVYEFTADLPGVDEKKHRSEARQRLPDDQGREAGREGGEEEGLLSS